MCINIWLNVYIYICHRSCEEMNWCHTFQEILQQWSSTVQWVLNKSHLFGLENFCHRWLKKWSIHARGLRWPLLSRQAIQHADSRFLSTWSQPCWYSYKLYLQSLLFWRSTGLMGNHIQLCVCIPQCVALYLSVTIPVQNKYSKEHMWYLFEWACS